MSMGMEYFNRWLSQYERGRITYMELFDKLLGYLAQHREDMPDILHALDNHPDSDIRFQAETLAKALTDVGDSQSP
jgi:hypothetical protein